MRTMLLLVGNFYGFKFLLLTKSQFPHSLIFLVIKAPHLLFPYFSFYAHPKTRQGGMNWKQQLLVQGKNKQNYWGPHRALASY